MYCADNARAWQRANENEYFDSNERMRRDDIEVSKRKDLIQHNLRTVANILRRYPHQIGLAAISSGARTEPNRPEPAFQELQQDHPEGSDPPSLWLDVVADLLSACGWSFESPSFMKAGSFLHRFQVGPLLFEKPIDNRSRQPEAIEIGLLFGITLFTCEFSSENSIDMQLPVMMPNEGRPMWRLAAAFLADALDVHLDDEAAANRLTQFINRNQGVGWIGWPTLPGQCIHAAEGIEYRDPHLRFAQA
jgi:hypothetical protein